MEVRFGIHPHELVGLFVILRAHHVVIAQTLFSDAFLGHRPAVVHVIFKMEPVLVLVTLGMTLTLFISLLPWRQILLFIKWVLFDVDGVTRCSAMSTAYVTLALIIASVGVHGQSVVCPGIVLGVEVISMVGHSAQVSCRVSL